MSKDQENNKSNSPLKSHNIFGDSSSYNKDNIKNEIKEPPKPAEVRKRIVLLFIFIILLFIIYNAFIVNVL